MCWESLQDIAKVVSYVGPTIAAFWALYVYWSGARRERTKWAESLYSRFFEKKELKEIREVLDCKPGSPEVATLVTKESPEFTDYLNFFELVAYLEESKQLKAKDVTALFEYYLDCLKKHQAVMDYIRAKSNGFEHLRRLLSRK
jgi:hypothetical protein